MITIENSKFTATINPVGAELTHLVNKATGYDYIWNDTDGKYWGRHAPLLFPAIGKSNNDQYLLAGTTYNMRQHGFARDYEFTDITQDDAATVTLTQYATPETKELYPFDYALAATFTLTDAGLSVQYTVTNHSAEPMPFALGAHPGFALDQPLENYTVTLTAAKTPLTKFGIDPVPFRNGTIAEFPEADGNAIPLSHALLDDGLIIVNEPEATSAVLAANDGHYRVTISLADFPYLTLWSPEGKNAPFVCVEPFAGLPDVAGAPSDWATKAGNNITQPGESSTFAFEITL